MRAKIDLIRASLDYKVKRTNVLESKRVKLLVPEKSLKQQL